MNDSSPNFNLPYFEYIPNPEEGFTLIIRPSKQFDLEESEKFISHPDTEISIKDLVVGILKEQDISSDYVSEIISWKEAERELIVRVGKWGHGDADSEIIINN